MTCCEMRPNLPAVRFSCHLPDLIPTRASNSCPFTTTHLLCMTPTVHPRADLAGQWHYMHNRTILSDEMHLGPILCSLSSQEAKGKTFFHLLEFPFATCRHDVEHQDAVWDDGVHPVKLKAWMVYYCHLLVWQRLQDFVFSSFAVWEEALLSSSGRVQQ